MNPSIDTDTSWDIYKVLEGYGIVDTDHSRPPSALTENSEVKAAEACSNTAQTNLYVPIQALCLARRPVLWHVQRTLQDTKFWTRVQVEENDRMKYLGFSSPSGKRMISWGYGRDAHVSVFDLSQSGYTSLYQASRLTPKARLHIDPSIEDDPLFEISLEDGEQHVKQNLCGVSANWALPADPLGSKLLHQVWAMISDLKPTENEVETVTWFYS